MSLTKPPQDVPALAENQRHLEVCSSVGRGDLFAVADGGVGANNGHIYVYSFRSRSLISEFDTIFNSGGHRMALFDSGEPLLIAGCFHRGIAGYDCRTGTRL